MLPREKRYEYPAIFLSSTGPFVGCRFALSEWRGYNAIGRTIPLNPLSDTRSWTRCGLFFACSLFKKAFRLKPDDPLLSALQFGMTNILHIQTSFSYLNPYQPPTSSSINLIVHVSGVIFPLVPVQPVPVQAGVYDYVDAQSLRLRWAMISSILVSNSNRFRLMVSNLDVVSD